MNIAISTLAFLGKSVEDVITTATQNNYYLEFSSGMAYDKHMEAVFINYAHKKLAHNYFPAPEIPFVLNLASVNDSIRITSINHCINGLHLSKKANALFFSAHAGFCIDPQPKDLGQQLAVNQAFNKQKNWELFIDSIQQILNVAQELGIKFLIENNVIAKMNMTKDGVNPLFCADSAEISKLYHEINHSHFGILLDTAHLKVSSKTLNFNLHEAVIELKEFINCIHHSDNNGILDTNDMLTELYWFMPFMPLFKDLTHVLEVKNLSTQSIQAQLNILVS